MNDKGFMDAENCKYPCDECGDSDSLWCNDTRCYRWRKWFKEKLNEVVAAIRGKGSR